VARRFLAVLMLMLCRPSFAQTTGPILLLTNAADAPSTMIPLQDYLFSEDTTLQEVSSMEILVTNSGDGELTWTASANQGWMSLSPVSGTAPAVVTVTVRRSLLAPGANYGIVSFASNGGDLDVQITAGCSDSVSGVPPCGTSPGDTTTTTTLPPSGGGPIPGAPGVALSATPLSGTAPLQVAFDASGTTDPSGASLFFVWDFGDAVASHAGLTLPENPVQALHAAIQQYDVIHAQWRANPSDPGTLVAAVRDYTELIGSVAPLTGIHLATSVSGFSTVDRAADYYLLAIGHDLSTIFTWHTAVFGSSNTCATLRQALLYAFDAEYYWRLEGQVGKVCGLEGTCGGGEIPHATSSWIANNCGALPSRSEHPFPMPATGSRIVHVYTEPGVFSARLFVTDGSASLRTAGVSITVSASGSDGGGAPGAYPGFGYQTTGGEGLPTYPVTSLADSGAGTLRDALGKAQHDGGGIIAFGVSGSIAPFSNLTVPANTTLDGTTAPGGGITIWGEQTGGGGGTLQVWYSNIIVRGLRIRNSGNDGIQVAPKGVGFHDISRIVIDHCSVTNSADGGIDTTGYQGHTLSQITLIGNYIAGSGRSCSKGHCGGGTLFKYGATNGSFYNNFYDKVLERTPAISGEGSTQPAIADIRYNAIGHTYSSSSMQVYTGASANVVGNYFLHPPQDAIHAALWGGHVFLLGNSDPGLPAGGNMPEAIVPFPPDPLAEVDILADAGAQPRDPVDTCYIGTAQSWAEIKAGVVCPTSH
jgi:hypothetical protein